MPLFTPPFAFVEKLRLYDSALQVRWSDPRHCWLIERKVSQGPIERPRVELMPGETVSEIEDTQAAKERIEEWNRQEVDERRAAAEGHLIECEVDRDSLDDRVIMMLWREDIWRRGGADAVNKEIDLRLFSATRKTRAQWMDQVRQEARAAFRYMNTVRTVSEKHAHTAPPGGMSIND